MMTYTPEQTLFPPSTTHFEGTFRKAYSISFSANGKFLAAGIDDCVYIWNTATWKVELCYQKNFSKILSVCWDASGILLFGCDGGWLTIISSGDEAYDSEGFHASQKPIEYIAVNTPKRQLALGGQDEVTIWKFRQRDDSAYHDWTFISKLGNPQDENDETDITVTSIAWAEDQPMHLVISYRQQGVVTWNVVTCTALFETGKTFYSSPTDLDYVLAGGCEYFAIPSGRQIRVYKRDNGKSYRCLDSPAEIPSGSPIIWAHRGACILGAVCGQLILWHVQKRDYQVFDVKDCETITRLAWNRYSESSRVTFRIAAVTENPKAIQIWRTTISRQGSSPDWPMFRVCAVICVLFFVMIFHNTISF